MSAPSAFFSSSSRSMRSIKDLSRSPAIPPTSGMRTPASVLMLLRRGEGGLLVRRRLLLVLLAPFVVGHAVDDLARLRVGQRHALFLGGGAVPFRQAVAAESGQVHQVDVLHVRALAQMLNESAEGRGFELSAGLVVDLVHGRSPPVLNLM